MHPWRVAFLRFECHQINWIPIRRIIAWCNIFHCHDTNTTDRNETNFVPPCSSCCYLTDSWEYQHREIDKTWRPIGKWVKLHRYSSLSSGTIPLKPRWSTNDCPFIADEFTPSPEVLRDHFFCSRGASSSLSFNSRDFNLKRRQTETYADTREEDLSSTSTPIVSRAQVIQVDSDARSMRRSLSEPSMVPSNAHSTHTRALLSEATQSSPEGLVCQRSFTRHYGDNMLTKASVQLSPCTASPSPSPTAVKHATPITFNFIPTRASKISALSSSFFSNPLSCWETLFGRRFEAKNEQNNVDVGWWKIQCVLVLY